MIGGNWSPLAGLLFLPLFRLPQLIHQPGKSKLSRSLSTLLSHHKLIYLSNHIEILVEYLTLIHYTLCHLSTHLTIVLCHIPYLHLQHIDVVLLSCQQSFDWVFLFFYSAHRFLWLSWLKPLRVVVSCYEGTFLWLSWSFKFSFVLFFHSVKQVNYLFGSFLDNSNQIRLFEPPIDNHLRYLRSQFFILLTCFWKVSDIAP